MTDQEETVFPLHSQIIFQTIQLEFHPQHVAQNIPQLNSNIYNNQLLTTQQIHMNTKIFIKTSSENYRMSISV